MYPSILIFLLLEILFLKKLTEVLRICSSSGPALNKKDFIDYGRINLDDYSWFDRGNCHFCAYANGITHMISATLDLIGECDVNTIDDSQKKKAERLLNRTFFWAKPVGIIGLGFVSVFSVLLRYEKADLNAIINILKKENFGRNLRSESFKSIYQNTFKLRVLFKSFQHTLSIIESNWCPLTYANKKLLLEHQEKFISSGFDDVTEFVYKQLKN